ncbi:hypothetical protein HDU93_001009, partial [Gonapodya sp. JEL0774]
MSSKRRTLLIFGATGKQGGACIDALLHRAPDTFLLRAVSRNPDSASAQVLKSKGVEVVKGDSTKPDTLSGAFEGVYGVFLMTVPDLSMDGKVELEQ